MPNLAEEQQQLWTYICVVNHDKELASYISRRWCEWMKLRVLHHMHVCTSCLADELTRALLHVKKNLVSSRPHFAKATFGTQKSHKTYSRKKKDPLQKTCDQIST